MSRSGYMDDISSPEEQWAFVRWRGAVNSALKGKRGQDFLKEMLAALDKMPEKRLEKEILVADGACCAMGAVAIARGIDVSNVDPEDRERVSKLFGIAEAMAAEISFMNDEASVLRNETPEQRYARMRSWVVENIEQPTREQGE